MKPRAREHGAIIGAAKRGHLGVLDELLKDGRCDPGGRDNVALGLACMTGNIDVVKRLLADPRVDPKIYNRYDRDMYPHLPMAIANGLLDVAELLIKHPKIDINGGYDDDGDSGWHHCHCGYGIPIHRSPLTVAVVYGSSSLVKLILAHPQFDHDNCQQGRDALEIAARRESWDLVRLLLADERFGKKK